MLNEYESERREWKNEECIIRTMDFRDSNVRGNDWPSCWITDRQTEQIHLREQLTNISVYNLMEEGNILVEYSFLCWADGTPRSTPFLFFLPCFCIGSNFGNNFWSVTASALSNRNPEHVSFVILFLFLSLSHSSRIWKINSKNGLRSSNQRKRA